MATITRGYSFGATEQVTNSKLHSLVDSATISAIVNADIDASAAISDTKLDLATIAQVIQFNGATTVAALMTMSGVALDQAKGSDIASATTTDIGAAIGNYVHVTGTTTITGLGTIQAGTWRLVRFTGALTFTHNATSLILPTAANITTVADDHALMISLGSGNWICANYARKSGVPLVAFTATTAPAGTVLQVVNTQTGAVATGTTVMPWDDTIPQITEGDEYMTLAITPNNSSNKLKIDVVCHVSNSVANVSTSVALFQDATAGSLAAMSDKTTDSQICDNAVTFTHYMAAGTTSATTFSVRAGTASAATVTFNGTAGGRKLGGVIASSITITEIKV